jgi:poly(hydroxyalkanoate) depolymerase family esterase
MAGLGDTVARMALLRQSLAHQGSSGGRAVLTVMEDFGTNPGALRAKAYVPDGLGAGAPLVVVLHGCTQTAEGYNHGSGWSQLAEREGFALLFPEQQRANNPNLCFNWFSPDDTRRGSGEALSIRQMVAAMQRLHGIDPARIFVTGLSAGGAMASAMLATYPEVFAGGAIIAGLPFGVAASVPQALERMRSSGGADGLADKVRAASAHTGSWPTVSVWHGSADATVSPSNASAIVEQWRPLHGVPAEPQQVSVVDGVPRRSWRNAEGREVIEEYIVPRMGHGTPLDPGGDDGCGASGAYMLDAGISSAHQICRFWGIIPPAGSSQGKRDIARVRIGNKQVQVIGPATGLEEPRVLPSGKPGVREIIEDALRSAGLMR